MLDFTPDEIAAMVWTGTEPDMAPAGDDESVDAYLARTWTPQGSGTEARIRLAFAVSDLWREVRDALTPSLDWLARRLPR